MGFLLMGFIGYFIKLIHIPINNIIVYDLFSCFGSAPYQSLIDILRIEEPPKCYTPRLKNNNIDQVMFGLYFLHIKEILS